MKRQVTNSKPCGALFRVRYVNSQEWSDVQLYVPVEHYQCGAVHVRYVNSRKWSDVRSYIPVEHYQCGAVRVRYINSREWSDVRSYIQVTTAICGARSGSPQYIFFNSLAVSS